MADQPQESSEAALAQAARLFTDGRLAEAGEVLGPLLASGAGGFPARNLMGLVAALSGDNAGADRWWREALALDPAQPETLRNHGAILRRLGRPEAALARYDAALRLDPDYAAALSGRANLLNDLGRWPEALESAERALARDPAHAEAANALGSAQVGLGRARDGAASYRRAIALRSDYPDPHVNLGNVLLAQGDAAGALESYDRAVALAPAEAAAWNGRGNALSALRRWEAAAEAYDRARTLDPTRSGLLGHQLHARMKVCDWRGFAPALDAILEGLAAGRLVTHPFQLLSIPSSPALQKHCAELYAREQPTPPVPAFAAGRSAGPIRVGYFSADFHNHATAYLLADLIETHDRTHFEAIGFSFGPPSDDPMRQRLQAGFDRFFEVSALGDTALADLARGLEIDIAVDLKGYTEGAREGVFARRAAPVQVSWLGFPGTLGAPFMDYLIADPVLVPADARIHYTEKIAYLGGSYQPNDRKRPRPAARTRREDHGLPPAGFVFASFNNNYKITPEVFETWMRLLGAVEGSVLWLFQDNAAAAGNLRRAASGHGLDPARLVFGAFRPLEAHLERHRHIDLFLDTAPYNAHTTASDALWMDTPLVTRMGDTFAGRVGASLLTAAGLPDLVTDSWEAYEALALSLARDPADLARIRSRLAEGRAGSRLFDTLRFTRELEALYAAMQARRLAGLPPEHIVPTV